MSADYDMRSKQAEVNRAKAVEEAQALRPHIERCIEAGRMSSNAIATAARDCGIDGSQWFPTPVHRVRHRIGLD